MIFTTDEFWWAVGLLLGAVCVGSALLWVALTVSNAKRGRRRLHSDPLQPARPVRRGAEPGDAGCPTPTT